MVPLQTMAGDDTCSTRPAVSKGNPPMNLATQAGGTVAAQQAPGRRPRTNAEAARYSVLRRLAPALKHDMVVHLQAVAMMAEVLTARIEKGSPSVAELEGSISKMNRLARDAVMKIGRASCRERGE